MDVNHRAKRASQLRIYILDCVSPTIIDLFHPTNIAAVNAWMAQWR